MSKITFMIDGLCAVLTGKLDEQEPELIVGLINVAEFDGPEKDYHHPEISIKAAGTQIKKYEGFVTKADAAFGLSHQHSFNKNDIYIHPPADTPTIKKYVLAEGMEEDDDDMLPFDRILKIDKELYPGQPLTVDLQKCWARLHFRHGLAYAMKKSRLVFVDKEHTDTAIANGDLTKAAMLAVELSFPDNEYVVLHFDSNAEDFVFKGGFDYQVAISNNPTHPSEASHNHGSENENEPKVAPHFHYYYSVIKPEQQPAKQFVPRVPDGHETEAGNPFCMPGGFDQP